MKDLNVQGGDVIKSINDTPITLESIRTIIGQSFAWSPDTVINMVLQRGEEEVAVKGKVGTPILDAQKIVPAKGASEAQKKLREVWMQG